MNALDYYNNPDIAEAIRFQIKFIKNKHDREDCKQEIWANLYDFMPLDTEEAIRLVNTTGVKFRRGNNEEYVKSASYKDGLDNDYLCSGQRKAHFGSAD